MNPCTTTVLLDVLFFMILVPLISSAWILIGVVAYLIAYRQYRDLALVILALTFMIASLIMIRQKRKKLEEKCVF